MSYLNRSKRGSSFTDFLFNMLLIFLVLLALLMMLPKKPQEAAGDIEVKAEYLIILSWEKSSPVDLDLWIKTPEGRKVFFKQKDGKGIRLDRDDLGAASDTIGETVIEINEEVATIRGTVSGDYVINAHVYYSVSGGHMDALPATIRIIKLNPYIEVYKGSHIFSEVNEEHTFVKITFNDDGIVENKVTDHFERLAGNSW